MGTTAALAQLRPVPVGLSVHPVGLHDGRRRFWQLHHAQRVCRDKRSHSLGLGEDKPLLAKRAKVMRHVALRQLQGVDNVANRHRVIQAGDVVQDSQSGGVCEALEPLGPLSECILGWNSHSTILWPGRLAISQ